MYHRRAKFSHRRSDAISIPIPMIRQHTPSQIARCPAQQTQKDLGFAAEEDNIFPYFWYILNLSLNDVSGIDD